MATYTCKYCGMHSTISQAVTQQCPYSPHKQHEWMNTTEKPSKYTCRYCGVNQVSPNAVTGCVKSPLPKKSHEWIG